MSRTRNSRQTVFEKLEIRQLLATVNVNEFGARPNDGASDIGAIRAAINATGAGDTIRFSEGVYDIPDGMKVASHRTYLGSSGTVLRGRNAQGLMLHLEGDNTTFRGLTFEGGGIFIDKPGGSRNHNVTIDDNIFRLDTGGEFGNGITFTSGLNDSRITNNYFTNYTGGFAVYGYNYDGLTITNNEVVNTKAGFHIDAFGNSGNLLVKENYVTGVNGMGFEFQGTASNLKFLDNWFENPSLSSDYNRNMNSMAFSLILDNSHDIVIKRNAVIAPQRPDGTGCRVGFELGGDNSVVEDNYINGIAVTAYGTDGRGTSSVTIRNNKFMNYQHRDYQAFPAPGRSYHSENNGPEVGLSWDINRGKPGRNSKLTPNPEVGGGGGGSTPQENEPDSDEGDGRKRNKYDADDFDYVSDLSWRSSSNFWGPVERDQSNGERDKGDGNALKIGEKKYDKGLGITVDSEVVLKLDGKYSRFFSDIGLDERVGDDGSMTFEVWADGQKVFDSGEVEGDDQPRGITVETKDVQELRLVTTSAGDGAHADHGAWGAARLMPIAKSDVADRA